MDIQQFDQFFTQLEQRIECDPSKCECIIRDAVNQSSCPYLKARIKELHRVYQIKIKRKDSLPR